MAKPKMQLLAEFGQSVWLDYISCAILQDGTLKRLIEQGLRGLTSNPSIFHQAISATQDYDTEIVKLKQQGKSLFEIYDDLTVSDIQKAADAFAPVYEATQRLDGYVSLEINPQLANHTEDSIQEAFRLVKKVGRPNLMIKVPATDQGFPVITELISQGISVNATLIFSMVQYQKTVEAYFKGLRELSATGGDLSRVHSVASVFVSRVDSAVDQEIENLIQKESNPLKKNNLTSLKGKAAVSHCLQIFKKSQELFASKEFKNYLPKKANLQRVLWASTSTKNPDYSDIKYVFELITENTVNTIPEKTLRAFLDHGEVKRGFTPQDIIDAQGNLSNLSAYGIDINEICGRLLQEGVASFAKAFESLFEAIEEKSDILLKKS